MGPSDKNNPSEANLIAFGSRASGKRQLHRQLADASERAHIGDAELGDFELLDQLGQPLGVVGEGMAGGVATDKFFQFLKFWLSSHIEGIDTKYAAHATSVAR
jgi:hypothetical protein